MTTDLALLGLFAGLGVVLVVAGMASRQTSLVSEMSRYDPAAMLAGGSGRRDPADTRRALVAIGSSLDRLVESLTRTSRRAQDLAVTDRTIERHAVTTATATMLGITTPVVVAALLATVGWHLPALAVIVLASLGGTAGIAVPTVELRRSAKQARARFLRGFSCWLELVALAQAGGMGVESALDAAGRISPDAAFSRIRHSLDRARRSGTTPWEEMGRLGSEIGVGELDELAASLGLAGIEGARIRSSLRAKSASLRRRQMSAAESHANSTTERLFLPSIILMVGFMVFLMYPAAASLANVL
jgi:Flp pilus assembly protein TadB